MTAVDVAQPDIKLLLDPEGVIREASVGRGISESDLDDWLGKPWSETAGDVGNDKIRRMLEDARARGVSAFRQFTQRFPSGLELPMEFTTVLLGGRAGFLAIGKSLAAVAELQSRLIAAQQSMERDYWKLREVETRYRLLFQASNEAIALVRAADLVVSEANQRAIDALELDITRPQGAVGYRILTSIAEEDRRAFGAMVARVREQGKAPGAIVHLGPSKTAWTVRASLIGTDPDALIMLQLAPIGVIQNRAEARATFSVDDLLERVPDGFVVVDDRGVIRRANRAFLDLVGMQGSVVGEGLSRWLARPGADLGVILANVRKHGAARLLTTTVTSELGVETEVEISAAGDAASEPGLFCLLIRDVGRRMAPVTDDASLRVSLGAVAEQIGKRPLRALVTETVGVVERHYVRSALDLAEGNRTMAAELLGLSRQSLYAKLERYGLEADSRPRTKKNDVRE